MDLLGYFSLIAFIIITCQNYKCNTLGDKGLFYKVDGSEKLKPIFEDDAPLDFCVQPKIPTNGNIICGKLQSDSRKYVCISKCDIGFEFPNKMRKGKIICTLNTGIWMPRNEFPDCREETICDPPCENGGICVEDDVCSCPENFTGEVCQKRLCIPPCQNGGTCLEKNTCSCTPLFEGDRCETDVCKKPPKPLNGKMWCSAIINAPNMYACVAECEDGYRFPNDQKKLKHVCDARTKKWIPKYEFPDCEAQCDPPCQNGGTCERGNVCLCTPNFHGDRCAIVQCDPPCENGGICGEGNECFCPPNFTGGRCEIAFRGCVNGWTEYFNRDNPAFSDIGDDESLDKIRETQPVCTGGIITDIECKAIVNGKLVDYREVGTSGLDCSKDNGFICNKNLRNKKCEDFAVRFRCECAECNPPCQNGGTCKKGNECFCTQIFEGDRCEIVQCDPLCENGGICGEGNECFCPPNFAGERCEIAFHGCVNGWTEYFNRDNPAFSDIGDDESLDKIRETQPVCTGGIITDIECKAIVNGKLVDYREVGTFGLDCSKDNGFICNKNLRNKKCEDFAVRFRCECAECNPPCQNGGTCKKGNECLCTQNFEGDRCEIVQCDPPCENGGICGEGNECFCPPNFAGERCEIAFQGCVNGWTEYFNRDNPAFSDIGDDESLDRIKETQPVCTGGIITDIECKAIVNGKLVDYRDVDTSGLDCSKDNGFICNKNLRNKKCEDFAVRFRCECAECNPPCQNGGTCKKGNECLCTQNFEGDRCEIAVCNPPCQNGGSCAGGNICVCTSNFEGHRCEHDVCKRPPNPSNAKVKCSHSISDPNKYGCIAECEMGYKFPHGGKKLQHICNIRTNIWIPEYEFPDCEAVCNPPCQNGGSCAAGNQCICTPDFEGNRCENAQCDPPCQNEGTCVKENQCICTPNFQGDRCENAECNPPCENGGMCEEGNKCICTQLFAGDRCEIAVCNPPCQNGGSCAAGNKCVCTADFEGDRCANAVCDPPCRNRGSCGAGNKCICTPDFEGDRCENDICKMPIKPRNGKLWCSKLITDPNMFVCVAECEEGYNFPDGKKKARHACNLRTKQWTSHSEFPDCEAKPSHSCISGWTEYFNTDKPEFSNIGDNESLDRIRGRHSVCPGGIVNDIECKAIFNRQFVDYREVGTVGLQCSKDTGFICNKKDRGKNCEDFAVRFLCECDACKFPPEPRNAKMICSKFILDKNRYGCLAECEHGYKFPNGETNAKHTCHTRSNKWIPEYKFPDCEAECDPPCRNGGTCEKGNKCLCSPNFEGDRCENEKSSESCNSGWTEYLNTDSPEFSDIGDDESLDRIREFESVCTGGTIKDIECKAIVNDKFVDYKEVGTSGLECSKETGFICDENIREKNCEDFAVRFLCECEKPPEGCNPPCQNGGTCEKGNKCFCTPNFEGDRCENAKPVEICTDGWTEYMNTDFPEFSVVGDDESLDRIREFQPVCPGGVIKDIECKAIVDEEYVDYKERGIVGLKCSKDTGFTCDKEVRGECEDFAVRFLCECKPPVIRSLPSTNLENCSTNSQSDTDTCEISGNVLQTFDGYTYHYHTCNHVLMKEKVIESFSVIVHRICPSEIPVNCYRVVIINVDGLVITFGPGIDTVTVENANVPLRSLWLVSQKFPHIELKQSRNTLVFRSLKYDFDVTWDILDNSKIKVSKCLINGTEGLCGLYNRKVEDDLQMPNGIMAQSDEEFGDSWAIGSREKCLQPNYTPEISSKADAICEKLREMPFKSCYKMADLSRKVQACFTFMRQCMQRSFTDGTESLDVSEKCKCLAFESFAEDCDIFKKQPAQEWRFLHGCVPTCSHGMEWQNCGSGCQLTCDNYHQLSKICNSTCVPGCYCPPGLVLHQNQCVKPNMCQDCICRGHGDHNYITFDGRHFAFQGTCSYILAQHLTSDDETMNFQVLGSSRACPEDRVTSCIQSLKILWNDHTIQKNIFHPVYLNRKLITPEESPYDEGGISIIYVPKIYTLIHIKRINLVVRYFDQKRGFTIELPSFYYYNKTEGLCGVCNFNKSDDLYHRQGYVDDNIKDFAYSWLRGIYKRKHCELAPVDALELPPDICNFTASPCEAILDPSPFLKSCQNDVQYSRRPEIYVCRSKFHYAQLCCERGVALDEWLKLSGCDGSCPEGMVYKCTSPCPKTCKNYKTYREDDCPIMPQNTCICSEDEVLKLGKCVKASACEVCDKKGHAVGDVWQDEPSKICECLPDLSTKCIVYQCPEPPVCSEQEMLLKVKELNDTCCDFFKCG